MAIFFYLRIRSSRVVDDAPARLSHLPDPEALQVNDGAYRDHELPVVGLRDLPVLPPHQDRGRHVDGVVRHLVQPLAHRLHAVPDAADATALPSAGQVIFALIRKEN